SASPSCHRHLPPPPPPSFPTRRSSDLIPNTSSPGPSTAAATPSTVCRPTAAHLTRRTPRIRCGGKNSPRRRSRHSTTVAWSLRRSEEHTSELQSRENLVCRLLLEKKKQ